MRFQGGRGENYRHLFCFWASLLVAVVVSSSRSILVSSFVISSPWLGCVDRPRTLALSRRPAFFSLLKQQARHSDEAEEDMQVDDKDEDEDDPVELPMGGMEDELNEEELAALTVPQLKQQLRLRGLRISGRKQDLIDRLLLFSKTGQRPTTTTTTDNANNDKESKARQFAKEHGKELVDVTEYLDEEDRGKEFKAWKGTKGFVDAEFETQDGKENEEDDGDNKDEVWGAEARIVDDYEGRRVVVDCMSQTVVEFKGSNQTYVSAFVVASRDALKPFLSGGGGQNNGVNNQTSTQSRPVAAEERLREIQTKRELANKRPIRFEDDVGLDEGDETGLYANVIERDYSDWGKYSLTGEQLSAAEVQGILLLSDVNGPFTDDTQALAEKIAFECQPVVVMVPDLFRGKPWKEDPSNAGYNEQGQSYEQWRAQHSDIRVSVDIRAAAACLRERYGVSSVVVWGTCFGGGRALEAVSGYLPSGIHDVDGSVGPPPVDPMATVAWYPTRYNASALFGKDNLGDSKDLNGEPRSFAVMAVFAGEDTLQGATPKDAAQLKECLSHDNRVKDHLVKVFPGQGHGFAHIGLGKEPEGEPDMFGRFVDEEFGGAGKMSLSDGDAEVACLLSTAFMETYSRVFLPTSGPAISLDADEEDWNSKLEMKDLSDANTRDIREEMTEALKNFKEEPLGGQRIDPNNEEQVEDMKKLLRSMARHKAGPYKIDDDDTLEIMYAKLKASDENFQLF